MLKIWRQSCLKVSVFTSARNTTSVSCDVSLSVLCACARVCVWESKRRVPANSTLAASSWTKPTICSGFRPNLVAVSFMRSAILTPVWEPGNEACSLQDARPQTPVSVNKMHRLRVVTSAARLVHMSVERQMPLAFANSFFTDTFPTSCRRCIFEVKIVRHGTV